MKKFWLILGTPLWASASVPISPAQKWTFPLEPRALDDADLFDWRHHLDEEAAELGESGDTSTESFNLEEEGVSQNGSRHGDTSHLTIRRPLERKLTSESEDLGTPLSEYRRHEFFSPCHSVVHSLGSSPKIIFGISMDDAAWKPEQTRFSSKKHSGISSINSKKNASFVSSSDEDELVNVDSEQSTPSAMLEEVLESFQKFCAAVRAAGEPADDAFRLAKNGLPKVNLAHYQFLKAKADQFRHHYSLGEEQALESVHDWLFTPLDTSIRWPPCFNTSMKWRGPSPSGTSRRIFWSRSSG